MSLSATLTGSHSFRILSHMCTEQKEAMRELLAAADNIGEAATCMHSGQGYTALHEARTNFQTLLVSLMNNSRICIEEQ